MNIVGKTIGGYRILERIGEGGMGAVYRAEDVMLEREVAIKAILPELARDEEIVARFRAEARLLARVSHPAIATIYSFFTSGDELFLAMEYVRGRSLARLLEEQAALPWESAAQLLAAAMDGIEQAHRQGIVHRDLKPENLMINEAGQVKVMDFGIARAAGSGRLTRTGLLVGTLRYMSPEQIRGEEVDPRSDVYALGAVLYEMLTGRVPFDGGSDYAVLKAHVEEIPRPPSLAVPGLPAWLDHAVLRALAKEPAERFQSVEQMRRCLLERGEPIAGAAPEREPSIAGLPSPARAPSIAQVPTPARPWSIADLPVPARTPSIADLPTMVRQVPTGQEPAPRPGAASAPGFGGGSYRSVELGGGLGGGRRQALLSAGLAALVVAAGVAAVVLLGRGPVPPHSLAAAASGAGHGAPPAGAPGNIAPLAGAPQYIAPAGAPGKMAAPAGAREKIATPGAPGNVAPVTTAPGRSAPSKGAPEDMALAGAPGKRGPSSGAGGLGNRRGKSLASAPAAPPAPASEPPHGREEEPPREGGGGAEELKQLAGGLETDSAELRRLYADCVARKGDGGAQLGDDGRRLQDALGELQSAAERFNLLFKSGFFARFRTRLGRIAHPGDEHGQLVRRCQALSEKGASLDRLMTSVGPAPPVRQFWQRMRRQVRRAATLCAA
jgi:serine/threonine protein kinase